MLWSSWFAVVAMLVCTGAVVFFTSTREWLRTVVVVAHTESGHLIQLASRDNCTRLQAFNIHCRFSDVFRAYNPVNASSSAAICKSTDRAGPTSLDILFCAKIQDVLHMVCNETNKEGFTHRMIHNDAKADTSNPVLDAELDQLTSQTFEIEAISTRWGDHMFFSICENLHELDSDEDKDKDL